MEIVYSIFIGIISSKNVGMIVGIGLQCRRDSTCLVPDARGGAIRRLKKRASARCMESPVNLQAPSFLPDRHWHGI